MIKDKTARLKKQTTKGADMSENLQKAHAMLKFAVGDAIDILDGISSIITECEKNDVDFGRDKLCMVAFSLKSLSKSLLEAEETADRTERGSQ